MSDKAQVHWITVEADAFVDKKLPDQTFQQLGYLQVGLSQQGSLCRSFLRFELPANLVNSQIWLASLVLYIYKNDYPNYAKEYGVFSVEDDWEQEEVTWNKQPNSKEGIVSSIFIKDEQDCKVEWDISPLIKKLTNEPTWHLEVRSLNEYENSLVSFISQHSDFPDKGPVLRLVTDASLSEGIFQAEYKARQEYYSSFFEGPLPSESLEILRIVNKKNYQAMVVYNEVEDGKPKMRAQQLLKDLASRGYLCFLCISTKEDYKPEEIENNLFMLNPEYLFPILRSQAVVVLCTTVLQMSWADLLPHKFLWYDVVEQLEFSAGYDNNMLEKHKAVLKEADFVTCSSNQLKKYVRERSDAFCFSEETNNQGFSPVDQFEAVAKAMPKGWAIFGNIDVRGRINVMTETFLNFEGKEFYSGGAERYLLDLDKICSDLGCTMNIYQFGDFPWVRRFRKIDVISLARGSLDTRSTNFVQEFNRQFYEQVQERSLFNIYSAFYEAYPMGATPNIGISHGVSWDNPGYKFQYIEHLIQYNRRYILGAKICEQLISVDTNTANWFQTIDYEFGQKIKVIPNYVDLEKFYPKANYDVVGDKIVVLYPRRLYAARGFYLVLDILDDILDQFPNVEFHFVGKGFENDTQYVTQKQNKWPGRVKWYSLPPEEMPKAYRSADISLIPTLYSEGTSLSCLEAMACGNAVIATRIGGLTDLVIDRFNGLRIEPNAAALEQALRYLLHNKDVLVKLKRNAKVVAETFSKTNWTAEWTEIIKNNIKGNTDTAPNPPLVKIYLKNMPDKNDRIGYLITALLSRGYLIYILIKNREANPGLSFGRVQWVGWRDEELTAADFTIADQAVTGDLEQQVHLTLTEAWLERFWVAPESSLKALGLS